MQTTQTQPQTTQTTQTRRRSAKTAAKNRRDFFLLLTQEEDYYPDPSPSDALAHRTERDIHNLHLPAQG